MMNKLKQQLFKLLKKAAVCSSFIKFNEQRKSKRTWKFHKMQK